MVKKFALCRTSVDLAPVLCLYEIIVIMFDCLVFLFMHFHWLRCQWRSDGQMCLFERVQHCGVPIVVKSLYEEGIPYEYRGNTQITINYVSWLISLLIMERFDQKSVKYLRGSNYIYLHLIIRRSFINTGTIVFSVEILRFDRV